MTVAQDIFGRALLDPAQPVPDGLSDGAARPAGRRFNVYRNNVAVSLTEAMHQAFPVIAKLLGDANMDGLAGLFLRAHPPRSPLMMHYGEDLPQFLAELPQLAHLPYLPDIARLELALRRSYHAADAPALDPEVLGRIPAEDLSRMQVALAPAAELVRSPWPIFDIWRFNTEDGAPKPRAVAQDVLITRPEYDALPHLLPVGGADWISALALGQSFGDAHDTALAAEPGFDLGATLAVLLQGGAIVGLTMKGQSHDRADLDP